NPLSPGTNDVRCGQFLTQTATVIRLLFVILLCALASSQATAQNKASQMLLSLSEDQRNAAVTRLAQGSNEQCDQVIRTLFNGTKLELAEWKALCRDQNSYSLIIPPNLSVGIELVHCDELLATSKLLLHSARSKSKPTGCRIKGSRRRCY